MSLFSFFRGRPAPVADKRHPAPGRASAYSLATQNQARSEMVRLALRDMLTRHGIPAAWIDFEVLWQARSPTSRTPTMHVRLLIRHLEPQLLSHGLSFQRSLLKRLSLFDPKASAWLGSVSWQFDLPESWPCPEWRGLAAQPGGSAETPLPAPDPQMQAQLEELRRLFAMGDSQYARLAAEGRHSGFEETRPAEFR